MTAIGKNLLSLRLGRIFSRPAMAAGFARLASRWPVWSAGGALVLAASLIDTPATLLARDIPNHLRDVADIVTRLGITYLLVLPPAVLGLVLLLARWDRVPLLVARAWSEAGALLLYFILSVATAQLIVNLLKPVFGRARPALFDGHGAFAFQPFTLDDMWASFPSGHATNLGAAAMALALIWQDRRMFILGAGALVATTRVWVAAHYPSDVVAGFLLGCATALFFAAAFAHARVGFFNETGSLHPCAVAMRRLRREPQSFSRAMRSLRQALLQRIAPSKT